MSSVQLPDTNLHPHNNLKELLDQIRPAPKRHHFRVKPAQVVHKPRPVIKGPLDEIMNRTLLAQAESVKMATQIRSGMALKVGPQGAPGNPGLDGQPGEKGERGDQGPKGEDAVHIFWAGTTTGVTGASILLSHQTSANTHVIGLDETKTQLTLPAGTYHLSFNINSKTSVDEKTPPASVVFHDTAGPLLVSQSQHTSPHATFSGSTVKIYPQGTTLHLQHTHLTDIQNGTVFIQKLH